MEYKIGDIVEIKNNFRGSTEFIKIYEVSIVKDSIHKEFIGKKMYKGKLLGDNPGIMNAIDFVEEDVKEVYRKIS